MKTNPIFIHVDADAMRAPLPTRNITLPPFRPFSELFEQDGAWIMGRPMLETLIDYCRGKHLCVTIDPVTPTTATVVMPMPYQIDDATGVAYPLHAWVPDDLQETFDELGCLVCDCMAENVSELLTPLMRQSLPANSLGLALMNACLHQDEALCEFMGSGPLLHEIVAHIFGVQQYVPRSKEKLS